MKYTIEGFSQRKLVEFGLDSIDAILIRYFADFQASGSMRAVRFSGEEYYWLSYKNVIAELPILGINTASALARRIDKAVSCGVLSKYVEKIQGTFTYFRIGNKFQELISDSYLNISEENPQLSDEGVGLKTQRGGFENTAGGGFENTTKDSSTKENSSTKNTYTAGVDSDKPKTKDCQDVIDYLNNKAKRKFTLTPAYKSFIMARFKDGAVLADFYRVIDVKVSSWANDENMARYLRPETLFNASKFQAYLNEPTNLENSNNQEDQQVIIKARIEKIRAENKAKEDAKWLKK